MGKDLTGMKFGKWEVLSYNGGGKWVCKCECGTIRPVVSTSLTKGKSKSCGCRFLKHGYDGTKIYRLWCYMRERCNSENHKSYKYYGGRGIKVCKEWDVAKNFIDWALSNGYKEGLTLDRINTDGDYSPNNCRFISNKEQQRNKRNNRFFEINGVKRTVSHWAEISGIDRHTLLYRINKGEIGEMVLRPTSRKKGGG